jgi:hypothetical protein
MIGFDRRRLMDAALGGMALGGGAFCDGERVTDMLAI